MQVFLSYRRSDVGGYAGRLADSLRQRLGQRSVFQDVATIAPGQAFPVAIDRALDDSDAVLAVIGPGWRAVASAGGGLRLFEADDPVRLELTRALHRDARVVPVLVGGAALPAAGELPEELRGLVQRQAVVLHDESWHQDVDGLIRSLRGEPVVPVRHHRRRLVAAVAAVALLAVGAGAWWWGPGRGGQAGSDDDLAACASPSGAGWTALTLGDQPTGTDRVPDGSLVFTVKAAHWRATAGTWQVVLATSMRNDTTQSYYHGGYRYDSLIVGQRQFKATCFSTTPGEVDRRTVGDALIGFQVTCEPTGSIQLVVEDDKARIDVTSPDLQPGPC
jgi:hypothetical protein